VEHLLDYANVTGRPPSRFVRTAAALSRGVGAVHRQHKPYAQSWFEANKVALTKPGRRWIVLGDSMSQGIGASRFDAGWVNQVHDRLARLGLELTIVNLSASGARVRDVIDQQIPAWRALPVARGTDGQPDLVTVLVGSNDLISRRNRDQLPERFGEMLGHLSSGAVVATLPQPRAAADGANARLEAAAARGGVAVVDMRVSGPASWRGKLASDHFHPNDAGYGAIADAFWPTILHTLRTIDQVS
jgi:lysophospholipase L1-like esterase